MVENILPLIGLSLALIGTVIAIIKLQLNSKHNNTKEGFDKGKVETEINHINEKLKEFKQNIADFEEDMQAGHLENDSIQHQMRDIKDMLLKEISKVEQRVARIEGPN